MANELKPSQYVDDSARATRVTMVAADGSASANTGATVQRVTAIQRVATATTTSITAGKKAYTVAVVTAASAASPTLGGVALPQGASFTFEAPPNDTLDAKSLVTVLGDDVIITSIT